MAKQRNDVMADDALVVFYLIIVCAALGFLGFSMA